MPFGIAVCVLVWTWGVGASSRLSLSTAALVLVLATVAGLSDTGENRASAHTIFLRALTSLFALAFGLVLFQSHDGVAARLIVALLTTVLTGVCLLGGNRASTNPTPHRPEFNSLVLVLPTLLLSLRGFLPLLPLSIAVLVAFGLWKVSSKTTIRVLGSLTACAGIVVSRSWSLNESYWYWLSFDQLFRASLSTGLTRWGYTDLNSAVGLSLHYHWLSEGVAGLVSRLGASDEYLVVTRVAPVLFFAGCFAAMWQLVRLSGIRETPALVGCSLTCLVLLEVDPYSIGTLAGAALVCHLLVSVVAGDLSMNGTRMHVMVITFLLLMTQTPFGIVLITTLFLVALQLWWKERDNALSWVLFLFVLGSIPVVLRMTLLKPGDGIETAGAFGFGNLLQFKGFNVPFGIDPLSPNWLRITNSLFFLAELTLMISPALVLLFSPRRSALKTTVSKSFVVTAAALALASLSLVNILQLGVAQGKLFSGLLLGLLPISASLAWEEATEGGYRALILGTSLGLIAAVVYRYVRNADSDLTATAASISFIGLASAMCLIWLRLLGVRRRPTLLVQGWGKRMVVTTVPLILVFGVAVGRQDRVLGYLNRGPTPTEVMIGSVPTRSCLEWIRSNTSSDDVIATNIFDPISLPASEKLYLVSAWTKRRVWIDGLYNSRRYFEKETERRVSLLGSPSELPEIVEYLVLDHQGVSDRYLLGAFELRFGNQDCRVLERDND